MAAAIQSPPAVATTCHAGEGADRREWSLVANGEGDDRRWALVFRGRGLDQPSVNLPLPAAVPRVAGEHVRLEYRSANGGRSVALEASNGGPSSLDVFVNFELEVNVERDLDRAVDVMNTDGSLTVSCVVGSPGDDPRGHEWMVGAGYGQSLDLLQSEGGRRYAATTVSWGRDLTGDVGPGVLRGRLMWAVEAMPLYGQHAPSSTVGAGLSPLVWRWRFVPRPRLAPFAELAFGGLFTRDPVPERTQAANFIAHGAIGVVWRTWAAVSLVTAYRFQHISNGNQQASNPGVNAHVAWLGLALGTRHRARPVRPGLTVRLRRAGPPPRTWH